MAVTTRRGRAAPPQDPQPQVPNPAPPQAPQPPVPNPAPPQEDQPPIFALSPALATRGIINYNSRAGERIYASATKELDSNKYDGEAQGLMPFLELLEERATNFGWDTTIMMIPQAGGNPKNLLAEYGTISMAQIRAHEDSYIATHTRNAQDSNLLYECIMNSISAECKAKLTIWKQEYRCRHLPSGNLLLKVLIRECHLDTNATVGGIRNRLSTLDVYLPTVGYNITKFNMYVKNLVDQLRARGEFTNDLLINLFQGYLSATDKSFTAYIDKKLEAYEEGQHMTANQLMLWARNKYDLLQDKGTWNAPTEEEEKIIALQTQIKEMAKKMQASKSNANSKSKSKQNSASKSDKKSTRRKEKPAWFNDKPKDVHKPVKWNNREWHWCGRDTGGHCEAFVIHNPNECKGLKKRTSTKPTSKAPAKKPKLKVEETITTAEQPIPIHMDDDFLL